MKSSSARSKVGSNTAPAATLKLKPGPGGEDRSSRIAVSAYYKAEARGFCPGYELEDWLAAEKEEQ